MTKSGIAAALFVLLCTVMVVRAQDPAQKFNLPDNPGWTDRWPITGRVWPDNHGEADVCIWAGDKMAAVDLTIDDNTASQHEWWICQMERYGWKATWFVMALYASPSIIESLGGTHNSFFGDWNSFRKLDSLGHAVESHTYSHGHCNDPEHFTGLSCPEALSGGNCCDIDFEYSEAQRLINKNIPGHTCWVQGHSGHAATDRRWITGTDTFYYDAYTHDMDIAAKYFIAGRGTYGYPNMVNRINYMDTHASSAGITGESVDRILDSSVKYWRGWQTGLWHLIQDTTVTINQFEYLKSKEEDVWIGLFKDIAMYGQSRDTHTLSVNSVNDSLVTFSVTDSMVDSLYIYPLTVKIRINNDWDNTAVATQNGEEIEMSIIEHEGDKYALVKAVPDGGEVALAKSPAVSGISIIPGYAENGVSAAGMITDRRQPLQIHFSISAGQKVAVTIVDIQGHTQMVCANRYFEKGSHTIVKQMGTIGAGFYMISFSGENYETAVKMMVVN